jgi:hypothetical protein
MRTKLDIHVLIKPKWTPSFIHQYYILRLYDSASAVYVTQSHTFDLCQGQVKTDTLLQKNLHTLRPNLQKTEIR